MKTEVVILWGSVFAAALVGYSFIIHRTVKLPQYFGVYLLFILVLFFHTLWKGREPMFLELFTSGGLFWLAFYNLSEQLSPKFSLIILSLSFVMSLLFIYSKLAGVNPPFESINAPVSALTRHSHIGDLWAFLLTLLFYDIAKREKWWKYAVFAVGIYFLTISLSRSAYLALVVGAYYIFYRLKYDQSHKKLFIAIMLGAVILFAYAGIQKSILLSRPYFLQSLVAVYRHPLGIGMGNFIKAGQEFNASLPGFGGVSIFAHNIIFEVAVGMGWFSIIFILWLIKILSALFRDRAGSVGLLAVFIAMTTNFMFDITYAIPTFLWLWFMLLGVSQKE